MSRYLWKRVLLSGAQVIVLSFLAFVLLSVAPGHFHSEQQLDPQRSAAAVDTWMREQGLAGPWPRRYAAWMQSCLAGTCGVSLAYGLPVSSLVAARFPLTAAIVIPAWIFGWLAGLSLAWLAAARPRLGGAIEPWLWTTSLLPEIVLGSLLLWLGVALGWPISGAGLPVSILALALASVVFLHARRALADAAEARFVQIARLRGVSPSIVWWRYVLPAAANPLVSLLAPTLVGATGSALAVEVLTGWPGLGPLFLEAFRTRDYPVVQAVLVLLGSVLTFAALAADVLLYRLDTRIRLTPEPGA